MTELQVIWYLLVGVLLAGYAILDGFDLGVGFWHLRARNDKERRTLLTAIGPIWDGNEVWLLTGAGALFAAFPMVYASVFSGFYLAMMLLLLCLISRAVAVEFRSKEQSPLWRKTWDIVFSVASTLIALLLGVALGNVLIGVPLDDKGNITGTFFDLLNPYALLIGITGVIVLAFHGACFIVLKTEGELSERARIWAKYTGMIYAVLFFVSAFATVTKQPHLVDNYFKYPILWIVPAITVAAIALARTFIVNNRPGKAIFFSSLSILTFFAMFGVSLFPRLLPALGNPMRDLTIMNSSSSELTLKTMFIITLIGFPMVLGYTIWVYRAFGGKVKVDDESSPY